MNDLVDWKSVPYCEIDEEDVAKYRLHEGDIVIARTGATVGYAKAVRGCPAAVFASYLVRIRIKEEHDSGYVGFVVESSAYKAYVNSVVGGSAQPNANAKVLASFRIPLPPKVVQAKIASLLSAYAELIENNACRIEILEEIAARTYKEWFVDFHYPGNERVGKVKSKLGTIPSNWSTVRFSDLARTLREAVNPGAQPNQLFTHFSIPAFDEGRLPVVEHGSEIKSGKYIVTSGSVLLSKLNPRISRVWAQGCEYRRPSVAAAMRRRREPRGRGSQWRRPRRLPRRSSRGSRTRPSTGAGSMPAARSGRGAAVRGGRGPAAPASARGAA